MEHLKTTVTFSFMGQAVPNSMKAEQLLGIFGHVCIRQLKPCIHNEAPFYSDLKFQFTFVSGGAVFQQLFIFSVVSMQTNVL